MRKGGHPNLSAEHGEHLMYNRGCRCDKCKTANAVYVKADRHKRGKSWVRNVNLKAAFGITLEQYENILDQQNGVCAVCKNPEITIGKYGVLLPLAVDHNHVTRQIRGLLCLRCNRALGLLHDSVNNIKALLEYRRTYGT